MFTMAARLLLSMQHCGQAPAPSQVSGRLLSLALIHSIRRSTDIAASLRRFLGHRRGSCDSTTTSHSSSSESEWPRFISGVACKLCQAWKPINVYSLPHIGVPWNWWPQLEGQPWAQPQICLSDLQVMQSGRLTQTLRGRRHRRHPGTPCSCSVQRCQRCLQLRRHPLPQSA